jgi:hypothetical protein
MVRELEGIFKVNLNRRDWFYPPNGGAIHPD